MPALRVASSALLVVAIVGAALVGEHALQFQELGELLATDCWFRMTVFGLWTLAMAPAARAGILAPGLGYLRWLPLPGWLGPLYLLVLVMALHGIVGLPGLVAGYPASGIGMALAGVGIGSSLLPGRRTRIDAAARAGGLVALLALLGLGAWAAAAVLGGAVSAWRLALVWRHGGELAEGRGRQRYLRGGAWSSLLSAQLLHLWRRESVLLARALAFALLGVILIQVIRRANPVPVSLAALLVASTPALAIVAAMIAMGLKRARRLLSWLLRSVGVSLRNERLGSFALLSTITALMAVAMALAAGVPGLDGAMAAAYGVGWAAMALALSSRARVDVRTVSRTFVLALVAMVVIGLLGPIVVPILLAGALLAAGPLVFGEVPDA